MSGDKKIRLGLSRTVFVLRNHTMEGNDQGLLLKEITSKNAFSMDCDDGVSEDRPHIEPFTI